MVLHFKIVMLIAILAFSGSFFLTYFILIHDVWTSTLIFMSVTGLANGLMSMTNLTFLPLWFDRRVGVASSTVTACGALGGAVFNQIVTHYINPNNFSPDATWNTEISFFTQPQLLERVPSVFLVIGGIAFGSQILGLLLMKVPPNDGHHNRRDNTAVDMKLDINIGHTSSTDFSKFSSKVGLFFKQKFMCSKKGIYFGGNKASNISNYSAIEECKKTTLARHDMTYVQQERLHDFELELDTSACSCHDERQADRQSGKLDVIYHTEQETIVHTDNIKIKDKGNVGLEKPGLSDHESAGSTGIPRKDSSGSHEKLSFDEAKRHIGTLLRSTNFYVIGLCVMAQTVGVLVVIPYFKLFGELWIASDSFLALVGSCSSALSALFQIGCGHLVDTFGIKTTYVIHSATQAFFLFNWYYTIAIND